MSFKAEGAPKITRVHTLHRIRTVVNYVVDLARKKASEIDDLTIANHLISTHLSKPTTKSFRDQIGRRARDHLETARYLGLLYRVKLSNKYKHLPTLQGEKLSAYTFEEACPKDYKEEAIFIDKVCRMKMTNTSYMQTPRGYEYYRSRVCLNILGALEIHGSDLSLFQIGSIASQSNLDVFVHKDRIEKLIGRVTSKSYKTRYLDRLIQDDIKNVRRDTGPFVDWCAQLDLVRISDDDISLTRRGRRFLDYYGKMLPVWWHDLGEWPSAAGAALLVINYLKLTGEHFAIEKLLHNRIKIGLFEVKINDVLQRALKKYYENVIETETLVDFSFQYDVPPEMFLEVEEIISEFLKNLGYKDSAKSIIKYLEMYFVQEILASLKDEAAIKTKEIREEQHIKIKVTAASIFSQFKSPYEATTYMFLKSIETEDFKTEKYQAQLVDFFIGSPRWEKFSKNNPDLLIINDFMGILECKSSGEWGETLQIRKNILNEIANYHTFCSAIKALGIKRDCIVVISYEGQVKDENRKEIEQLLEEEFPNVIIVTQYALQKALVDVSFKNTLKGMIKGVEKRHHIIM